MKNALYLVTALFVGASAFSAESVPSPFKPGAAAAKREFEQHGSEHHKWKKGQPFPESLAEAGLLDDAALVWSDMYLDGGTRGYLLKDSAGNCLAVCSGPGLQGKDHPNRIDAARGSRLFIGALHYTKEEAAMVLPGSKAEAWLRKLLDEKKG